MSEEELITKDKYQEILKENRELKEQRKELNLENQALYESIKLEDSEYLAKKYQRLKEENKKLKRENEALEIIHETYKEVVDNGNYISKDEIKQIIGYEENEDVSKDEIISLLKTMWEEFNRLEDIEDKMFTKYISKDIIRNKIKEVAEEPQIYVDTEKFDIEFEKSNYTIDVLNELLGE